MIIGNQTKLYYKKKSWLTPKHPLYFEEEEFKVYYAAAVMIHAEKNQSMPPEKNYELERLLHHGLELEAGQMVQVLKKAADPSEVLDYLCSHTEPGTKRYLLMLDLYNISAEEQISRQETDNLWLFARMLEIPDKYMRLFEHFIREAHKENEGECRRVFAMMTECNMELSLMELKYYLMTLYDVFECTQEELEKHKQIRLVDRCVIRDDIVLRDGMELRLDHAVVRIYGNITIDGGKLIAEHSRIIRKSGSHRACMNIRRAGSVRLDQCDIDCRNYGMLLRAQDGEAVIRECEIYHTTRGAAVRFWGAALRIEGTLFHHCYSNEEGGAVLVREGVAQIVQCRFWHCEAVRGGAVYGRNTMEIRDCLFKKCYASEYGAAVFCIGFVRNNISGLHYTECFPERTEMIQYIVEPRGIEISEKAEIGVNTILDCELDVTPQGSLWIHDAVVYLRYPIRCRGYLEMDGVYLLADDMQSQDMVVLEHARGCRITKSRLDGMGQKSGIFSAATKLEAEKTVFCNMKGGRAVFNAYQPQITSCVFNYCQNGGVHCQGGMIQHSLFVNCRGKSGAGVTMISKKGLISHSRFVRCISDISGGAVDKAVGNQMIECEFTDCISGDSCK